MMDHRGGEKLYHQAPIVPENLKGSYLCIASITGFQ